ncbi:glycosyltransferase family 2 protein [Paenibacillus sp. 32O-W]|uniref:glycosyltransferase family 2 protein n=1 Tax=Paenibacillus sp. 32O-W TaxID=1695218 RepID=UPI0011A47CE6|nr:glycosyltransferase family 2 protein [Paenibacillus sp. 32O-W]
MKTVSIHIVTYNSESDIEACLEAVLQQSYPIQQVIVIDNNSHDTTIQLLEKYLDRIHLVQNKVNVGFAPAHNHAMRISNSDYCLVLNPDVVLHPDYVRELMEEVEDKPEIGSATGKLLLKSTPDLVDSTGLVMNKARRAFDRGAGTSRYQWDQRKEIFGVSGAAALYSRRMIMDISIEGQFYDENFFAYKEDVDVAWRAQIYGWKAVFVPEASAYHERGWKAGNRKKQPLFIRQYSYINRYRMMIKNDHPAYILKHLPFITLYELASLSYVILREPGLLKAWKSVLKEWGPLRRQRSIIQQNRKKELQKIYSFFQ